MNTAGSGNWSAGATWVGGVPPTTADTAVILNGHTVTLDNTSCVALSVTVNSGGTLTATTASNWTLTSQTFITNNGTVSIDLSTVPAISGSLLWNASVSGTAANIVFGIGEGSPITLKGYPRKRITKLTTALTANSTSAHPTTPTGVWAEVIDATGWRVGDQVCFATTQAYNSTPRVDLVTIATITTTTSPAARITWTDGTGTGGSVAFDHAADGYVGNFTSNLTVGPPVLTTNASMVWLKSFGSSYQDKLLDNVKFSGGGGSSIYPYYGQFCTTSSSGVASGPAADPKLSFNSCVFSQSKGGLIHAWNSGPWAAPQYVADCAFYTASMTSATVGFRLIANTMDIRRSGVFAYYGSTENAAHCLEGGYPNSKISDSFISAHRATSAVACRFGGILNNVEIFASRVGVQYITNAEYINCKIGTPYGATNSFDDEFGSAEFATLTNTSITSLLNSNLATQPSYAKTVWVNKNNDVTQQEIYQPFLSIKRENTIKNRSTSSIAIRPTKINLDCQRTLTIPCANGSSIRVIGYVQRQSSATQVATVALSGLGSAWGGFTAANNTTWQVWDTGTITNSSGADGNYTLTYTASDTSSTTGVVYFDGVPDSPFVTKARHYGFTFDEANPVRTTNTVLKTLGVTEATAIAYTGVTISPTQITVGAGTADTWLKVYGYAQAYACDDLTTTVNLTSTDGNTFALPLTYKLSWPTMGTDGTLAGGWLLLAATGTHTYKLSGTKIEFQTAGSYTMSASTFSGTVELVNTSGGAVTVYLPSGTSYTNTGPSITVSTPIIQQSVTLTGVVAGSRVQIYDTTNSIELFNGTSGYSWTDSVAAVAPRDIRVRIAYQSGTTAYNFVEANIGTCGTTSPSNAVTYLASQTLDTVYNANGLDGSAVSGITISDGIDRMVINIGGGSVSWPQIYAYNVYWLTTSAGIVDDGSIIVARDTANYSATLFKIRNSSTTPLNITGGYGTDSSTGTVAPLIDTAGSTGNIYQTPDHVVAYQTTGTYAITGDIATVLTAVSAVPAGVLSAASAAPIAADIKRVNAITVNGDGAGTPWGP